MSKGHDLTYVSESSLWCYEILEVLRAVVQIRNNGGFVLGFGSKDKSDRGYILEMELIA